MILEKLDTVSWHELSHAYGAADDVPQLLRDIASPKEKKRARAYNRLYSTIYHQGTIYQASAYAVPFLIELLNDEQTPKRHDIIDMLVALAQGSAYPHSEEKKQSVEFQEQYAQEVYWVQKTHQAVRAGIDSYLALLTHTKRRLRMGAINILRLFKEDRSKLIPILSAYLQTETDQASRACMVFSLGQLVEYGSEQYNRLVLLLVDDADELVKIAAAMAFVSMGIEDTPTQAVELLLKAIVQHRVWEKVCAKLPWLQWRFVFDVIGKLHNLSPQMNDFVIPQLLQLLAFFDEQKNDDDLNDDIALEIAQLLLYLIFRGENVREGSSFEDLSSEQQQILQAIVSTDAIWSRSNNLGCGSYYNYEQEDAKKLVEVHIHVDFYALLCLGLPDDRKALREFVHQAPFEQDEIRYLMSSDDMSPKKKFQSIQRLNPQLSKEVLQYIRDWNL